MDVNIQKVNGRGNACLVLVEAEKIKFTYLLENIDWILEARI